MDIQLNWLAIIVALVASLILAKTWYAESAFGKPWRKLTGVTPKDSKLSGNKPMIITLLANVVTIIVLAAFIHICSEFFKDTSIWHAALVGFFTWLAFSATTLLTHNAFERKPDALTAINNGYQFVLFLISALIIGTFGA
jgi:hypothetical protein